MTTESQFIALMRQIATDPSARGLNDDAAVIDLGSESIIICHDMMAEGVHWLASADAADVAWKLVSVNLSDLAAKGAVPLGLMLGFMMGDQDWDGQFAIGLEEAVRYYGVPLLGGDTVSRAGDKRSLGMTAIGKASHNLTPSRRGAKAGDILYVTGTLGDALAGYEFAEAGLTGPPALMAAYHRPEALLQTGQALAPHVTAMMDVSDGLLLDASRMAQASGLAVSIDLDAIPLSAAYALCRGDALDSRMQAASWGDDYQLLFAAEAGTILPRPATPIGQFTQGGGLSLRYNGEAITLPATLGYQHG
jgi:thiamine-monophosphate kinase